MRLLEVLEASPDAAILPADQLLDTQSVADRLGVSRMTIARFIDRGMIEAAGAGRRRKARAVEVDRYPRQRAAKRRDALVRLAQDVDAGTPADEVIRAR